MEMVLVCSPTILVISYISRANAGIIDLRELLAKVMYNNNFLVIVIFKLLYKNLFKNN